MDVHKESIVEAAKARPGAKGNGEGERIFLLTEL
jgi:hypothetical protein